MNFSGDLSSEFEAGKNESQHIKKQNEKIFEFAGSNLDCEL